MRALAPQEASGVPPHSLSVPTLAIPLKTIRYFRLSVSQTPTLCYRTEMSLGDSEMAQCKSVQWTLSMSQTGRADDQGA